MRNRQVSKCVYRIPLRGSLRSPRSLRDIAPAPTAGGRTAGRWRNSFSKARVWLTAVRCTVRKSNDLYSFRVHTAHSFLTIQGFYFYFYNPFYSFYFILFLRINIYTYGLNCGIGKVFLYKTSLKQYSILKYICYYYLLTLLQKQRVDSNLPYTQGNKETP